jgi:hypothetical protein
MPFFKKKRAEYFWLDVFETAAVSASGKEAGRRGLTFSKCDVTLIYFSPLFVDWSMIACNTW